MEVRELSLRKEELYREILQETGITVLPGARELLNALRELEVPFAVGSSTHRQNIELAIREAKLEGFRTITSAEDVQAGKPAPEVFIKAAASIQLKASQCIVIEDSHSGIEAANRGNFKVVGVATTNPPEALKNCDLVVHRLTEVSPQCLKDLL